MDLYDALESVDEKSLSSSSIVGQNVKSHYSYINHRVVALGAHACKELASRFSSPQSLGFLRLSDEGSESIECEYTSKQRTKRDCGMASNICVSLENNQS